MTERETVEVHYILEGPEDAPVLVLANSLGTTLHMWDDQAPALGELIRDSIPDADFEVIPNASHLANIERPEVVTRALLEHLEPVGETRP